MSAPQIPPAASTLRPRLWRRFLLAAGALLFALLGGLAFIFFLARERQQPFENEREAIYSLRLINSVVVTYSSQFTIGFPSGLASLGPGKPSTCSAADLIDAGLATGQWRGYVFQYTPGKPIEVPHAGCPQGVSSYTLTAIPIRWSKTGSKSFFTDQSAVIRVTTENRIATAQDPPIQ